MAKGKPGSCHFSKFRDFIQNTLYKGLLMVFEKSYDVSDLKPNFAPKMWKTARFSKN